MMIPGYQRLDNRHATRFRRAVLTLAVAMFGLSACDGETLYGPVPIDPDSPPDPQSLIVRVSLNAADRMELSDSLVVRVETFDLDTRYRIMRAGYTLRIHPVGGGEPIVRTQSITADAARGDTVATTFVLHPDWVTQASVPADFDLELYGWTLTDDGRCSTAVPESPSATFACSTVGTGVSAITVGAAAAAPRDLLVVRGRTTPYPMSQILVGDLQVDTARGRVFLSNRLSNRLHVFRPATFAWQGDVLVGAEPWGMHLNAGEDTLLVANSGGNSISYVDLAGAVPVEVVGQRLFVRNTALFEVQFDSAVVNRIVFHDFSDRPQFVAQDAMGRILYSTRPTLAAPLGTVRVIERQPGWDEPETRNLVRLADDLNPFQSGVIAVAHVDSIRGYPNGDIQVYDHLPGFPSTIIASGQRPIIEALQFMRDSTASDIEFMDPTDPAWAGGYTRWFLNNVSFADTTYVATSRDRNWVAFGDGGEPTVGRIVLWHAPVGEISSRLPVADLVNNASERVRSLDLNSDGTLGAARGAFGTYFFSRDLRLRGNVPEYVPGGAGSALHPEHPTDPAVPPTGSSATTLAFTATGDRAIRILDTVHYHERGRILVRDDIVGPLRVTLPFASDNGGQGRNCQGSGCVVLKVFAGTATGGILVADILASDILP